MSGGRRNRQHTRLWQAARDARKARRAADPAVQARALHRQQQAARDKAKRAGQDEAA